MSRFVVFVVGILLVWGIWGILRDSIEPVVSTEIALQQMHDTTEGHAVMRAYGSWPQRFLYGPLMPGMVSAILFLVMYGKKIRGEKE